MRFAIIENGHVANTALADAPMGENWIQSDTARVGDVFDGKEFTQPSPLVEQEKPIDLRVTGVAFKRRFTTDERIAIRKAAAVNDHVYDYMDLLDSAPTVRLDDADVVNGLRMLEAAGMLPKGRADEILSAPVTQDERP